MSRRLGLIIGVNQYQDSAFQRLQFAENDARALAQWLVNDKGGKWSPAHVQLVQGQHVTRELVKSLLTHLCMQVAESGDLIFIYFAGHTFLDERSGDGYLALANTRYYEPTTGIHLPTLVQQLMLRSAASQILLVLDCFQTGRLWSTRRSSLYDSRPLLGPSVLHTLQQQANRLVLCSCRGNEQAPEGGERSLGLFTHRFIVGLCGPAVDPTTGIITLQQLHSYLYNALEEQQRPHLFGQLLAPLVFVGDMPSPPIAPPAQPAPPSASPPWAPPSSAPPSQPQNYEQTARQAASYATATAQLSPSTARPEMSPSSPPGQQQPVAALLEQTRQFLQMQNYPAALSTVERALLVAPQDAAALTLKGQILGTLGHTQEALAVLEQLTQLQPQNPLPWSIRAVLLSNMGQHQAAMSSIERSLELDANNPETYAIKTSIMSRMAANQSEAGTPPPLQAKGGGPLSFLIGAILQMLGFLMGIAGLLLPLLRPTLPIAVGLAITSLGTALIFVVAARGAYKYGVVRLLFTLFLSLLPLGILGASYKLGEVKILAELQVHPSWLIPLLFLGVWLAIVASVPFILALIGFLVGLIRGVRRQKS